MNKEFIPYEQALELKELGFDGADCLAIYNINKELETGHYYNNYVIDAPLYQQAFRWFREKYGLASQFAYYHVLKWTFEILEFTDIKMTPNKLVVEYSTPKTYEEAELACLKKLIEIVKSNTDTP